MNYKNVVEGIFLGRPNRFIAHALVHGQEVVCHVKNTGRCRELLIPGVALALEFHPEAAAAGRKTEYSVIGVYKENALADGRRIYINMDSQAPNQVAAEWLRLQDGVEQVRREVTFQSSRFDLAYRKNGIDGFMEVKGVTLENGGVACFPDAPTERGVKHLTELASAVKQGFEATVLFVIQMKGVTEFTPNMETHPEFGYTLKMAADCGVRVLACDCEASPDTLSMGAPVKIVLPLLTHSDSGRHT